MFQVNNTEKFYNSTALCKNSKNSINFNNKVFDVGFVVSVSDEIVNCTGLKSIKLGEIIFCKKKVGSQLIKFQGLVVNIAFNIASCIFFANTQAIGPGTKILSTGSPLFVLVSSSSLGQLVDCLGYRFLSGTIPATSLYHKVERPAPGITYRQSIGEPLHTGNILVDGSFPIGRGQRELILGDRQTGKTTVAINAIRIQMFDSILQFFKRTIYCIYVAVGQKKSNLAKLFSFLKKEGCMSYTIIVATSSSDPASLQFLAPYTGCSIAEYFRDRGQDTLVIYDDLSKQAVAYRQITLLLRRPPGREAYPGDIFYLHARLLERAAKMSNLYGGGSLTALPVVETLVGDITSYIPTNVISITDGQIFLDNQIFNKYYKPAINIELSVSRVGSNAQLRFYRKVSNLFKRDLLKYIKLIDQNTNASDALAETRNLLDLGTRMFLIISHKNPLCVELQFFLSFLSITGFLNKFILSEITSFLEALVFRSNLMFFLKINFFKAVNFTF